MERKDLLLDQIEQVGRAIAKVLAEFLGTAQQGTVEYRTQHAVQQLKADLDVDLELLYRIPKNELQPYLEARSLNPEKIESLADLLVTIVEHHSNCDAPDRFNMLQLAAGLYGLSGGISRTFSFERDAKEVKVKKLIEAGG